MSLGVLALLAIVLLAGCDSAAPSVRPLTAAGAVQVLVGASSDVSEARPLAGQTLGGAVHLFVPAEVGAITLRPFVDGRDPAATGLVFSVVYRADGVGPWPLVNAQPWDTRALSNGPHTLTVVGTFADRGAEASIRETFRFDVANADALSDDAPPAGGRLLFGAWTSGGPWHGLDDTYYDLERRLGFRLDVVHWYASFSTRWMPDMVSAAAEGGRTPMITWEAYDESLDDIANGIHDDRLREWARGAAAYGELVYLRPFQEMNAHFFPWGMDPEAFVAAWRRIVDVFRDEGARNVLWVWSPNAHDNPETATNKLEHYYPGADYVDVLAIDGYNWGTCRPWSRWTSFERIMQDAYARVSALGDQPIWIAEFGSTELGGDKAQWIREAFATTAFPRVEALIYFDEDTGGGCDWNIDTSAASERAFIEALALLAAPNATATALAEQP